MEFPTKNEPRLVFTDFIQGIRGGLESVEFRLFQLIDLISILAVQSEGHFLIVYVD